MNKSKAARSYLVSVILGFLILGIIFSLLKHYEKVFPLLILYSVYLVISIYIKAFGCLKKHMINNMDKAVIIDRGVVTNKYHKYPEGIIAHLIRHSKDSQEIGSYKTQFYSSLEVLKDNKKTIFNCTNSTYEHTIAGDQVVIVEFPEVYELGSRYCCFLEKYDSI